VFVSSRASGFARRICKSSKQRSSLSYSPRRLRSVGPPTEHEPHVPECRSRAIDRDKASREEQQARNNGSEDDEKYPVGAGRHAGIMSACLVLPCAALCCLAELASRGTSFDCLYRLGGDYECTSLALYSLAVNPVLCSD
jgi:hypothetical protein